jgi:hypothetical protein
MATSLDLILSIVIVTTLFSIPQSVKHFLRAQKIITSLC